MLFKSMFCLIREAASQEASFGGELRASIRQRWQHLVVGAVEGPDRRVLQRLGAAVRPVGEAAAHRRDGGEELGVPRVRGEPPRADAALRDTRQVDAPAC